MSRIKRRNNVDLIDEIKAELEEIDKSIKMDDSLPSDIVKFNHDHEIHSYNPKTLA